MTTLKVEELSLESFNEFGYYKDSINPTTEHFGMDPVEFYRDMLQLDLGTKSVVSFSVCKVLPRDFEIVVSEYHSHCGEGILPLDNDIIIHVAPAAANGDLPVEKMRVFKVPMGTMVILKPGVFHHAPWTTNEKPASSLIVLPVRTYANDCIVIDHKSNQKIKFTL